MPDHEAAAPPPDDPSGDDSPPPSDDNEKPSYFSAAWLASDRVQILANVLTIIVALAAIGLSVWEGLENRRHNRLSVLPHLEPVDRNQRETDSTYMVRLAVENTGLGPAVLENVIYFRDGTKIYDAKQLGEHYALYGEMRNALEQLPFGHRLGTQSLEAGEMLKAGEEHLLIQVQVPYIDTLDQWTPGIMRDNVFSARSFVFCYCSVYGEDCNMTFLGAEPPEENVCGF